jgi:hypothetical protein
MRRFILFSPRQIFLGYANPRSTRWAGHVTCRRVAKRNTYRVSLEKPERKRPLGRSEHRWKHNMTMELKEIERESVRLDSSGSG